MTFSELKTYLTLQGYEFDSKHVDIKPNTYSVSLYRNNWLRGRVTHADDKIISCNYSDSYLTCQDFDKFLEYLLA